MLFAKPPQIDPISVDLAEMTDEILSELAEDAEEQGTELRCELADKQIAVLADRERSSKNCTAGSKNSTPTGHSAARPFDPPGCPHTNHENRTH